MTEQSEDPPVVAEDRRASLRMVEEADAWIDLSRANTEGERLMHHLTTRYEDALATFLPAARSDPEALHAVLQMLVRQMARAQADIFVLKSAVLGRDRMVLTRDWDYQDPLRAQHSLLGEDVAAAAVTALGRYALPLTDSILGFGWHEGEGRDGRFWRWSGPGLWAGLTLPKFFEGPVRLEITFNLIRRDVLPSEGAIRLDGMTVPYSINFSGEAAAGKIIIDTSLASGTSPFFLMEFIIARTYSPHKELGSNDKREVGICVRQIVVARRAAPAASAKAHRSVTP